MRSQSAAESYEREFNRCFKKYEEMRPKIQAVCDRFDKLEAELRRCETGTSKFKEIYSRSIAEYKDQCAKGKSQSNCHIFRINLVLYFMY